MADDDRALVDGALALEKHAVSRLISLFEDQRPQAATRRAAVMAELRARSTRRAWFNGITGTPGSGKSTLVGRLALEMVARRPEATIAVLAVDPSSRVSGGALLGDRTRTRFPPGERRLFFRSQAAEHELGGLGPWTFQVCRLLSCLYDFVFVETVGIGQSEADIRHLADRVFLVLQPLAGDEVQFLKAGIMEVPHAFIVNKCDEPAAERSYHQLRGSLWLARPFDEGPVPIHRTSARTGAGVGELAAALLEAPQAARANGGGTAANGGGTAANGTAASTGANGGGDAHGAGDFAEREAHFFRRWVREEWGRAGERFLDGALGGAEAFVAAHGFDAAQLEFAGRAGTLGR